MRWCFTEEIKDTPGIFENIQLPLAGGPNWVELKDMDGDGWVDAVTAIKGTEPSAVIYGPLWETFTKLAAKKRVRLKL